MAKIWVTGMEGGNSQKLMPSIGFRWGWKAANLLWSTKNGYHTKYGKLAKARNVGIEIQKGGFRQHFGRDRWG